LQEKIKMEEIISQRAVSRYCKIVQSYKEALKSNPDLRFKAYCNETHTHYYGALDWLKRNGISINEMRREARIEIQTDLMPSTLPDSSSAPTFVQFQPRRSAQSQRLGGVSITFPDGINLTLQESGVEEVIALLDAYQTRRQAEGGARPCSL